MGPNHSTRCPPSSPPPPPPPPAPRAMTAPLAEPAIPLCHSADLVDGGLALAFDVRYAGRTCRAFAIRYRGQAHAYLNRCTHVAMELDYQPRPFSPPTPPRFSTTPPPPSLSLSLSLSLFRSHFVSDSSHEPGWERATLEKLAFATLNEQRSIRRWRTFFRLVWLVLIVSIALVTLRMLAGLGVEFRLGSIALVTLRQTVPGSSKSAPHTAMVDIRGEIAAGADASAEFVVAAMRSALENDGFQALVLLINSPGGGPVQAGIINDEIRRLKAEQKKADLRRGRKTLRLGGVLHCRRRR